MSARFAIGFGATSTARADDVVALINHTLAERKLASPPLAIATLDRRARLAHEVAAILAWPVLTFDAATLAAIASRIEAAMVVTVSPRALASVGTPSVAEAAALAALAAPGRLVGMRATGENCTCAIAEFS